MEHDSTDSEISPTLLWQSVANAIEITGIPQWVSPEPDGVPECLAYLEGQEPVWALVPVDWLERADSNNGNGRGVGGSDHGHDGDHEHGPDCGCDDEEELVAVAPSMAADLLRAHFRSWLAERGWQVQLGLHKGEATWRLADCLSFADGGGDRLDRDYPHGPSELDVLCEAIVAVTPGS